MNHDDYTNGLTFAGAYARRYGKDALLRLVREASLARGFIVNGSRDYSAGVVDLTLALFQEAR